MTEYMRNREMGDSAVRLSLLRILKAFVKRSHSYALGLHKVLLQPPRPLRRRVGRAVPRGAARR